MAASGFTYALKAGLILAISGVACLSLVMAVDNFTRYRTSSELDARQRQQFELLLRKTEATLKKVAAEIGAGNVEANPSRNKGKDNSSCRYCDFKDACQFDTTMRKDKFRVVKSLSDALVFERLREEAAKGGMHDE